MPKKPKDYEVGYKKPPKAHQFQPGESGNKPGRPKKPCSSNDLLEAIMSEKVTIVIKGRRRKVTMKEVLIRQLVAEGMKGNPRALKALFNRESERVLDEATRSAEQIKRRQEFDAEFDKVMERIRKKAAEKRDARRDAEAPSDDKSTSSVPEPDKTDE